MSTQKIAVALINGTGTLRADQMTEATDNLRNRLTAALGEDVVIQQVDWARALREKQYALMDTFDGVDLKLRYTALRNFVLNFVGGMLAYQPTSDNPQPYQDIHQAIAADLQILAANAGAQAPLCIIAHSLGAVIMHHYLDDLQQGTAPHMVKAVIGDTPLEQGETLVALYMLGAPLGLYAMRLADFGSPIVFPAPKLREHYPVAHHPDLTSEWINFYDRDDVMAYPISRLNDAYRQRVRDVHVNVGGMLDNWNPASHMAYWGDKDVIAPIVAQMVKVHAAVNT